MRLKTALMQIVFAGLLLSLVLPQPLTAAADKPEDRGKPALKPGEVEQTASIQAAPPPSTCTFGYTLSAPATYSWIDTSAGGVQVIFENTDDDVTAEPIPLGFNFKFFENSYSSAYISTNGLLSFGLPDNSYRNVDIPRDIPPNGYIAPFWDDLELLVGSPSGDSQVFYRQDASPRRFVVEWRSLKRHMGSDSDRLTFQVILYENGDIRFQYQTMQGDISQATAGIEDGDGRDGLRYFYNQPLAANGTAVQITRPIVTAGVKTLPAVDGKFILFGAADFKMYVRNTGESGADAYNLSASSTAPGWKVELFQANGVSPLTDTNGDGTVDTGQVPQGQTFPLTVRVSSPPRAAVSEWSHITITARSQKDSNKFQASLFQTSVPASFAQAYTDANAGFRMGILSRSGSIHYLLEGDRWFSGSTLALVVSPGVRYMYAWETSYQKDIGTEEEPEVIQYSDIEFMELDRFGVVTKPYSKLTNNAAVTLNTQDRFPTLAAGPNGKAAFAWIRDILSNEGKTNSNLWFAVTRPGTTPLLLKVTANASFRGEGDLNIPLFHSPSLALVETEDGQYRFLVVWSSRVLKAPSQEASDIWYAIFNPDGTLNKTPAQLTNSLPGSAAYTSPIAISLQGGQTLAAYTLYNEAAGSYQIAYRAINPDGSLATSETVVPGEGGRSIDGVQLLPSGRILLAWVKAGYEGISYALLEGGGSFPVSFGAEPLYAPDLRHSNNVSVTRDQTGSAVITWADGDLDNHLYYALVGPGGELKTPPLTFLSSQQQGVYIITSSTRQGNAPSEGAYQAFLPVVMRP
jgi:hypothetical protein